MENINTFDIDKTLFISCHGVNIEDDYFIMPEDTSLGTYAETGQPFRYQTQSKTNNKHTQPRNG